MSANNTTSPLTFGLDIGIASVGWAVLNESRVVDLGVRAFDAAEDPKEKISLNQARRSARTGRNRNAQRRSRLNRLEQLFVDVGLLSAAARKTLFADSHTAGIPVKDIWELRALALTRTLHPEEFARILHHLVKWRGYGSLRDAKDRQESEAEDDKNVSDESVARESAENTSQATEHQKKKPLPFGKALDKTASLVERLLPKYGTVGNLVYRLSIASVNGLGSSEEREAAQLYKKAKHNHSDGYERSQLRTHLRQEIQEIFRQQRMHGNLIAAGVVPDGKAAMDSVVIGSITQPVSRGLENQVLALFDEQHPPIVSSHMDQLVGNCQLEPTEKRAPKWSYSAERSHWLQTLNQLKVRVAGEPAGERFLSGHERAALIDLPYQKTEVTYADLRNALCEAAGWPKDWRLANFAPLRYRSVATPQSDQIKVIQVDGEKIKLLDAVVSRIPKNDRKTKKKAVDEFKEWLVIEAGKKTLTFASIRARISLEQECLFSMLKKIEIAVLPDAETAQFIPLSHGGDDLLAAGFLLKTRSSKGKTDQKLTAQAMSTLRQWCRDSQPRTLADLRSSLPSEYWPSGNWQFILEEKSLIEPSFAEEAANHIDLSFSDAQSVEKETRFARLPGWHKLKTAVSEECPLLWASFQPAWQAPNSPNGLETAKRVDDIFEALTKNFTDTKIENALAALSPTIPLEGRQALLKVVSTGFAHLSFLALRTIRSKLEEGYVYSKACELSPKKYDHSGARSQRVASKYLPKLETYLFRRISVKTDDVKKRPLRDGKTLDVVEKRYKDLANPVVARSFNQARNVLNALIQTYGSPAYVSIELAREMSKPGHVRKEIEKENKARAAQKELDRDTFIKTHDVAEPTATLIRWVRMRNEQNCKCIYSGKEIDLDRMLKDPKYVEVDHVLPKSRTADNSLDNQVLVLTGENQRKGNRTPYEWKGKADPAWWHSFKVTVLSLPLMSDKKKRKLLLEELDEAEFTSANLVDTRYVTRLFARAIREGLLFDGGEQAKDEAISPDDQGQIKMDRFMRARVRTPQGGVTSTLRGLWGLSKNREAGDLHHAIDACVAAAATPALIQRLNAYNRFNESVIITPNGTAVWRETGELLSGDENEIFVEKQFPQPFHPQMFHQEVMARLSSDGRTYLTKHGEHRNYDFANYAETERANIRVVTVSRLVERHRINNELHDSNPKALRHVHISAGDLTPELLDLSRYPRSFAKKNRDVFEKLSAQLRGDDVTGSLDEFVMPQSVRIPWLYLTPVEQDTHAKRLGLKSKDIKSAYKSIPLTALTKEMLTEEKLGSVIWKRDELLINALRSKLNEPNAKAAVVFANGFPKPTSPKQDEKRKREGVMNFQSPLVHSLRVPDKNNSGFIVRGGIVGQGAATSVLVVKNLKNNQFEFIPRYAAKKAFAVGLPDQNPTSEKQELFELLKNTFVKIKHPNVIYCFTETGRRHDEGGAVLIDVEPVFPDGIFHGYFNNYAPSNKQTELFLHDKSPFYLLADNKTVELRPLTLIQRLKLNTRKNAVKDEIEEFVFQDDLDIKKPRTFALVKNISRMIGDAKIFERVAIDNLGRTVLD
jgi:CRISPR/Cas system Type II protein with McrA/HNH and RuvC-like nuclease domain